MSLNNQILDCTKCELRNECNSPVPGWKSISKPQIMLIGEAPGADEDLTSEPFVGRSGKLLTKILNNAGVSRETCYITNAVKCRPKNNKTPSVRYINVCRDWIFEEIDEIKPNRIITFGVVSLRALVGTKVIGNAMGKFVYKIFSFNNVTYVGCESLRDVKALACYHPAYLLRGKKEEINKTIESIRGFV